MLELLAKIKQQTELADRYGFDRIFVAIRVEHAKELVHDLQRDTADTSASPFGYQDNFIRLIP